MFAPPAAAAITEIAFEGVNWSYTLEEEEKEEEESVPPEWHVERCASWRRVSETNNLAAWLV